jgi:uncharacterized membrane protein YkgB
LSQNRNEKERNMSESAEIKHLTPEEEEKKANNRYSFMVGIGIGFMIIVVLTVASLIWH